MHVTRHGSGADFVSAAAGALDEVRDNLAWALAVILGARPAPEGAYLATVSDGKRVVATALRTPGRKLVLGEAPAEALAALATDLRDAVPELSSVSGPPATARSFARLWCEATGGRARDGYSHRLLVARARVPTRPGPGRIRLATNEDAELLAHWVTAFNEEVDLDDPSPDGATIVRRRLADGSLHVWEDREVVSMAAVVGRTPTSARLGRVYTPGAHRAKGYATRLVGALTAELLEGGGCATVSLFSEPGNPVSNRLYERLGYTHVMDVQNVRLV